MWFGESNAVDCAQPAAAFSRAACCRIFLEYTVQVLDEASPPGPSAWEIAWPIVWPRGKIGRFNDEDVIKLLLRHRPQSLQLWADFGDPTC